MNELSVKDNDNNDLTDGRYLQKFINPSEKLTVKGKEIDAPKVFDARNQVVQKPEFDKEFNAAIIFADHNDTILRSQTNEDPNPRVSAPNPNMADLNFFDEVNAVHNTYKSLARYNSPWSKNTRFDGKTLTGGQFEVSVPNSELTTTIAVGRDGNFGSTLVRNWGAYTGDTREQKAFNNLRDHFVKSTDLRFGDAKILKDLYRLECIREPAALITNVMFIDLAMLDNSKGYTGINPKVKIDTLDKEKKNVVSSKYVNSISYDNIRRSMPMAPRGAVNASRCLWRDIIKARKKTDFSIYYRYDYIKYEGLKIEINNEKPNLKVEELIKLENNLLFNYIMHQVDQLYTVDGVVVGAGNITARLRTNVLIAGATVPNQQAALTNNGSNNTWVALGAVPAPLVATIASIYEVTVLVTIAGANHNIVFQARFPIGGAPIQATDIFITSFPLALINQLLLEWYQVDIGLPNQDIQIDLQLRA